MVVARMFWKNLCKEGCLFHPLVSFRKLMKTFFFHQSLGNKYFGQKNSDICCFPDPFWVHFWPPPFQQEVVKHGSIPKGNSTPERHQRDGWQMGVSKWEGIFIQTDGPEMGRSSFKSSLDFENYWMTLGHPPAVTPSQCKPPRKVVRMFETW